MERNFRPRGYAKRCTFRCGDIAVALWHRRSGDVGGRALGATVDCRSSGIRSNGGDRRRSPWLLRVGPLRRTVRTIRSRRRDSRLVRRRDEYSTRSCRDRSGESVRSVVREPRSAARKWSARRLGGRGAGIDSTRQSRDAFVRSSGRGLRGVAQHVEPLARDTCRTRCPHSGGRLGLVIRARITDGADVQRRGLAADTPRVRSRLSLASIWLSGDVERGGRFVEYHTGVGLVRHVDSKGVARNLRQHSPGLFGCEENKNVPGAGHAY